jgi:hypothetical protein
MTPQFRATRVFGSLAFCLAAYMIVQINRIDRAYDGEAMQAEIAVVLSAQGMAPLPMFDAPGMVIDSALRFRPIGCAQDAFVVPFGQGVQSQIYAIRFTELTGALYQPQVFHMDGTQARRGFVSSQLQRNLRQLATVFGLADVRNSHMMLAVYVPVSCDTATLPDFGAFWSPDPPTL